MKSHTLYPAGIFLLLLLVGCLDALFVDPNKANQNQIACDAFTDIPSKDSCYAGKAKDEKSVEWCVKVQTLETRDHCYADVATAASDGKICLSISSFESQKSCANANPAFFQNQAACAGVDLSVQDACYRHSARILFKESACEFAGTMKNACLQDVAVAALNPAICDMTTSSDAKES